MGNDDEAGHGLCTSGSASAPKLRAPSYTTSQRSTTHAAIEAPSCLFFFRSVSHLRMIRLLRPAQGDERVREERAVEGAQLAVLLETGLHEGADRVRVAVGRQRGRRAPQHRGHVIKHVGRVVERVAARDDLHHGHAQRPHVRAGAVGRLLVDGAYPGENSEFFLLFSRSLCSRSTHLSGAMYLRQPVYVLASDLLSVPLTPKSQILTTPRVLSRILDGRTSRWMMFRCSFRWCSARTTRPAMWPTTYSGDPAGDSSCGAREHNNSKQRNTKTAPCPATPRP